MAGKKGMQGKTAQERYEDKCLVSETHGIWVDQEDGSVVWSPCVDWTGAKDDEGYGNFFVDGKVIKAHRFGYYVRTGKYPPKKLVLDHLCSRHGCQEHTEAVTQFENVRRGQSPIGLVMRRRDNKYKMTVIAVESGYEGVVSSEESVA